MKKTWHQIARNHNGDLAASFELEIYKKMLDIFQPGEFYYYIANIAQVEMEFISDGVTKTLGIGKEEFSIEYIFDCIHPEDKGRFILHEQKVTDFFNILPAEKTLKYKVSYDYRLRCKDGSYKWILQQVITIQSTEDGAVIRVMGVHTDITHLKTDNRPSGLSFLGLDGEPSYCNVDVGQTLLLLSKEIFSKREKEVLRLIIEGRSSREIADTLHISRYTVDSHRKKILFKSNCKNLVELGARCIREGWL
ncbi:LuxR C-terminal-related transcriptional regulator [Pedobacter nanyangensis]|uniref:LuxR C-terminal-related transcriptional regulator n=1 Tax=Pedobacter nanyangensis TaxID=1562389 RepID=UPI0013B3CB0C|nr:LuxR C-terminal-related transcriptional regulator [Pedobacter nanyangensis]